MLILNVMWKELRVVVIGVIILHTLKNIKRIFLEVLPTKVVCIDDKFSKPVDLYRGKNAVYKFIDAILIITGGW